MLSIPEIAQKSYVDCHVKGLDSLVLETNPMRRVFIARPDHNLYQNMAGRTFSVGYHPHHCDVEFKVLMGKPLQVEPLTVPGEGNWFTYEWESPIRGERGRFIRKSEVGRRVEPVFKRLDAVRMVSTDWHTVFVEKDEWAVWEVREGREDSTYRPLCTSNDLLETFKSDGLYRPITEDLVRRYVKWLNLR